MLDDQSITPPPTLPELKEIINAASHVVIPQELLRRPPPTTIDELRNRIAAASLVEEPSLSPNYHQQALDTLAEPKEKSSARHKKNNEV